MQTSTQQALYRLWRPQTFDAVCAQNAIKHTLREAVKRGNISHAYLFCGTRGTGKTSLAKIFSRAINCQNPKDGNPCNACEICQAILQNKVMDVLELDAASNNSVDNIRHIIDEVPFLPAMAKFKVYIIDEVHMLSSSAFNALLKTLEEPPAHVVFILATTEPQKIPATILSRCQRYDLQRIAEVDMAAHLTKIADSLNLKVETAAMKMLINLADGGMRDAISLLDQCKLAALSNNGVLSLSLMETLLGKSDSATLLNFLYTLARRDTLRLISLIDDLALRGLDYARFLQDLAFMYRQVLLLKLAPAQETRAYTGLDSDSLAILDQLLPYLSAEYCLSQIHNLSNLLFNLKNSMQARITLEVGLLACLDSAKALPPTLADLSITFNTEPKSKMPADVPTERKGATTSVEVRETTLAPNELKAPPTASKERAETPTVITSADTAANEPLLNVAANTQTVTASTVAAQAEQVTFANLAEQSCIQQVELPAAAVPAAPATAETTDTAEDTEAPDALTVPATAAMPETVDSDVTAANETVVTAGNPEAATLAATEITEEVLPAAAQLETASLEPTNTKSESSINKVVSELDLLTLSEQLVAQLHTDKQTSLSLLLNYRPLEQEGSNIILPLNKQEAHLLDILNLTDSKKALAQALKTVAPEYNLQLLPRLVDAYGNEINTAAPKQDKQQLPAWLEKLQNYAEQEQLSFTFTEEAAAPSSAWD